MSRFLTGRFKPLLQFSASTRSDTRIVLELISQNKSISLPKLAVKTKLPTEELNSVIVSLEREGVVKVETDLLGFSRIELKKEIKFSGRL